MDRRQMSTQADNTMDGDRTAEFLVPTEDANYRVGETKIPATKEVQNQLEKKRNKKHQHEDGSYPISALLETARTALADAEEMSQ